MTNISSRAEAAREAARSEGGQFGHQERTSPAMAADQIGAASTTAQPSATDQDLRRVTTCLPISAVSFALKDLEAEHVRDRIGELHKRHGISLTHFDVADALAGEDFDTSTDAGRYLTDFRDTFSETGRLAPLNPHPLRHARHVCDRAGLTSMVGIYELLHDRGDDSIDAKLSTLTSTTVQRDYEHFIGPAIDELEDHYLAN